VVTVEKIKNKLFRQYEIYVLIGIIIIALALLFFLTATPTKEIQELKNYQNGKFNTSGFVSDLKVFDNYTKFKLSDSTDSIQVIAFYKITDITVGTKIDIICNLQTTNYGKECVID